MEKYYIISGVALANIQFRESRQWYQANSHFENEKISESQFNKFRRFFKIEKQEEVLMVNLPMLLNLNKNIQIKVLKKKM